MREMHSHHCSMSVFHLRRAVRKPRVKLSAIDLNLLLIFDVVMQERSVTRAGDVLGLSQSAVSHALSRLRHMLKDELLVRSPSGMVPTPRAEHLAVPVREALERLRQSLEPETFDPATQQRTFSIGVNNYAEVVLVAPIYSAVAQLAPNVMLEFRQLGARTPADLLNGRDCELAIGSNLESAERYATRSLLEDGLVILMHKDHPAAALPELPIEAFAQLGHLELTSVDHSNDFIEEVLAKHQLKRRIQLRASYASVDRVLAESDLVTLCPRYIAKDLVRSRPLAYRELPFSSLPLRTSMIWPRQLSGQPSHRWLRSIIERVAESIAGVRFGTRSRHPR
jgi:DNA-binding transcriptional LysR family regulator